jgi:hypothetical protein
MAVMDAINRARCAAQFMREVALPGLVKADLTAAVAAADDWVEANSAAYNTALPQPFRNVASTTVKGLLLCFVIMRRNGRLRAQED